MRPILPSSLMAWVIHNINGGDTLESEFAVLAIGFVGGVCISVIFYWWAGLVLTHCI
jgi:hypothetical protein